MLDRFPEIYEVEAVMPGFKVPTEEGIEEVISTIAPFLSVSGGSIELIELDDGEGVNPRPTIVLGIGGPPAKNASLKAEVVRRVKFIYGQAEKLGGYIGVSSEILFAFSHCLFIFVQTVPETCFHACLR
ncbi:unnamed protein product [Cladocopium goreaui]|uniref:Copia protein n=1 Tax=Cladocopium goreaui TaxID=2562237 RepID=A0A9P1DK88_9DINO|nr:unnamed protein product [Cladocopium goreaui]